MDISRLLNDPRPPKRPRLFTLPPGCSVDDDAAATSDSGSAVQQWSKVQLSVDAAAYVMEFVDASERPMCRLVNQVWYAAYNRYHRYVSFSQPENMGISPRQLISTLHDHGLRLRYIFIFSSSLAELVRLDPNLSTRAIPNVSTVFIVLNEPNISSKTWLLAACQGWKQLRFLTIYSYGFAPDRDFPSSLNQLLCRTPRLGILAFRDISIRPGSFPDPHLLEIEPCYAGTLSQLTGLNMSLEHFESAAEVAMLLEPLHSVTTLGFDEINDLSVLDAVAGLLEQPGFIPKLDGLSVTTGLDMCRTPAITVQDTITVEASAHSGTDATAEEQTTLVVSRVVNVIDTMNRFRDLNRPHVELSLGFVLGACSCSTTHPLYHQSIDRERQFLAEFSSKCIPRIKCLKITHYTPSVPGYYWPLDALFHCDASFPWLTVLELYVTPMSWFKDRLADIIGSRNMLPKLALLLMFYNESSDIDVEEFVSEQIDNRGGALSIEFSVEDVISEIRDDTENGTFDWNVMHEVIAYMEGGEDDEDDREEENGEEEEEEEYWESD
ncbi:hypothetical protein GQ42DRAFT_163252 [Ramicandelaber brevisporus]|nr:hypothetical protein GQ42DRAFT_163252 [Ramicandelaber brevisporus]